MVGNPTLYRKFDEQLTMTIRGLSNDNPAPRMGIIINISEDKCYVDVLFGEGVLKGVEAFGYPLVNTKCILEFLDGNYGTPVAICNPINTIKYADPTPIRNKISNGTFQNVENNNFQHWTGGAVANGDGLYNNTCCMLQPAEVLTSEQITISDLEQEEGEVTPIMIAYNWKGGMLKVTIYDENQNKITLAPENLGYESEILPSCTEWRVQRTFILLREHEHITVEFENIDEKQVLLLDGVRVWNQDFEGWYPSELDKEEGKC